MSRAGAARVLLMAVAALAPCAARILRKPFRLPPMLAVSKAVTPREYQALERAIGARPDLGRFARMKAVRIHLGAFGEAFVVYFAGSPECGATGNCPIMLFAPSRQGMRAIAPETGGWGCAVVPQGGAVPGLACYWNIGASQSDVNAFGYTRGQFTAKPGLECGEGHPASVYCAAMSHSASFDSATPGEYAELATELPSNAAGRMEFENAHATELNFVNGQTGLALATSCQPGGNCRLSIYARDASDPGGKYQLILGATSAWAFSQLFTVGFGRIAIVIARRLPGRRVELSRYLAGLVGDGFLHVGTTFLRAQCEWTPVLPATFSAAALASAPVIAAECRLGRPAAAPSRAMIPGADPAPIESSLQDATGRAWAIGGRAFQPQLLSFWTPQGWTPLRPPAPQPYNGPPFATGSGPGAVALWPGWDGGVLVVWRSEEAQDEILQWRRGDELRQIATYSLSLPPGPGSLANPPAILSSVLAAASVRDGVVLVTGEIGAQYRNGERIAGEGPGVYRLRADGELDRIYSFDPSQFLKGPSGLSFPRFQPSQAVSDGQGHVWIYSSSTNPEGPTGPALRGFAVTDGTTVRYLPEIPGLPAGPLAGLWRWDSDHLAAAVWGRGLYSVDLAGDRASLIAAPVAGAFADVRRVFVSGDWRLVLTWSDCDIPAFPLPPVVRQASGTLWRFRGGAWTRLLWQIATSTGAMTAGPGGVWLSASGRGLWWLPDSGRPRRFGWRQAVPVAAAQKLYSLPDGTVLAINPDRSTAFSPPQAGEPAAGGRFRVLPLQVPLAQDPSGRLWSLLPGAILADWNGSGWQLHMIPAGVSRTDIVGVASDTGGRIWLLPDCRLGPMGVFDPAARRWHVFTDYHGALAAQPSRVRFMRSLRFLAPIYGPDSRLVFVGRCGGVNYYDAGRWHLWNQSDLPFRQETGALPFFDAAGHLALDALRYPPRHIGQPVRQTWEWTAGGWHEISYVAAPKIARSVPAFAAFPRPPVGCDTPPPSNLVSDAQGDSWWVADDALYEGRPGRCQVVLSGAARQPFTDGRRLARVVLDRLGNAFVQTVGPDSYLFIPASPRPANSGRKF
ncbi:MAG: hypothetical protein ACRD2H_06085 [Terriglobales bacterium]